MALLLCADACTAPDRRCSASKSRSLTSCETPSVLAWSALLGTLPAAADHKWDAELAMVPALS